MIHIKRPPIPPPDLKGTKAKPSIGETELARAIAFYTLSGNLLKPFPFAAYGSQSVKESLNELFFGKCAYCESKYIGTQPVDVEHYRPKGGVLVPEPPAASGRQKSRRKANASAELKLKLQKPGYYWLAATWDNLLPSCIDCNRERNQKIPDVNDPNKKPTVEKVGKGSNFPLADESKRRRTHKSRKREAPLLLDPTRDRPEEYLEFTAEGMVRPTQVDSVDNPRGKASIKVYALQRIGLVQERRARALMVLAQIERVRRLVALFNQRPNDKQLEKFLDNEREELEKYVRPEAEYAGMARQLIRNFVGSLLGR
ncbi:MAG TPA: hypothetical protein VJT74_02940 [Pyrinomonadaceae bacterium]|nr:hypothetical protein [Pyrinomonadaceae bacterium]